MQPPSNNQSGSGSGETPGEPISRSSSRERPVFDAYPMPPVQVHPPPGPGGVGSNNTNGLNGGYAPLPAANQAMPYPPGQPGQNMQLLGPHGTGQNDPQSQSQLPFDFNFVPSPYTFPVDPSVNFPPLMPNQGAPLDPAVESMLASYFPSMQTSGSNANAGGGVSGQGQTMIQGPNGQQNHQPQPTQLPPQMVGPEDFLSRVFSFGWNDAGNVSAPGGDGGQGGGNQGGGGQGGMGGGMNGMMGFGGGGDWTAGGGGWMA